MISERREALKALEEEKEKLALAKPAIASVDIRLLHEYVNSLDKVLAQGTNRERRDFVRTFIRNIEFNPKELRVRLWGLLLGVLTYLVDPTAAFYALWVAVLFDLLTKIVALAVKNGGLVRATRERIINSHTMFYRTFIKVLAYFTMTVLAHQSKAIVAIEAVPIIFSTIIYSILFLVEVHSIIENLIEAGAEDLKPLLMRFEREKQRAVEGAGDMIQQVHDTKMSGDPARPPDI